MREVFLLTARKKKWVSQALGGRSREWFDGDGMVIGLPSACRVGGWRSEAGAEESGPS